MSSYAMARCIELWPAGRLVPYDRNPRTHSDEQVAQIAASIAEFGFCNPVLVDTANGIIAGHGRLLAARKLNLEQIPVIVLNHLTPAQRRAYVLADNKLALNAGWDEELLAAELSELEKDGFDPTVTGFSDEELKALLADDGESFKSRGRRKNHMTRTSVLLSITLGLAMACSAAAPAKPLSKKEAHALIAKASTPADHNRLAEYYRVQADKLDADARDHAEMANMV